MNLSLTPISEAWDSPKQKQKRHNKENQYTVSGTQKQMLSHANQVVHNNTPGGYSDENMHAIVQMSTNGEVEKQNDDSKLVVHLHDPDVIEMLKPYKDEYISNIVQKSIAAYLTTSNGSNIIETFVTSQNDIGIIGAIVIALLFLDIIIRLRI